ncbi:uncharacterized protein LOC135836086 [Planococcus citri]|uniref:uncharacterized protein LOC135836086 n=1 Tax=Planococcus citri TaxID=170843 RepID=UPI0031F88C41
MNPNYFRSKLPKFKTYAHPADQQNQKTSMANYREIIPNRKLTVKRGVFPYAIHANPVSKQEVFGKDQHLSNDQNDSFQKQKNVFNLFNEKNPSGEPLFENKTKPAASTGFFGSNTQRQATPIPSKSKNPGNEDVTLSSSSNTTKINKKVLLDQYLTEQYNAVVKAKNSSTTRHKFMNFDAQEAFQICTYKRIGEVMNESIITASSRFKCSLELTSKIRKNLCKLHIERKNEQNLEETRAEFPDCPADKCEPATHKENRPRENVFASSPNNVFPEKKRAKNENKMDFRNGGFRFDDSTIENDRLSYWKGNNMRNQLNGGNDRNYQRSPRLFGVPEKSNGYNLTPSSPPNINRNFEKELRTPVFLGKAHNRDNKNIPLSPTRGGNFSPNDHLESGCKAVNSPTLFFSDTVDSPITPKNDENMNATMPANNKMFSLDSAVFKRKFSPELANPIEILKCSRRKSKSNKKKTPREKIITPNPSYSDSTCHGARFKHYNGYRDEKFLTRRYKYSKFNLNEGKYFS